jgi:hypothetical protein
MKASLLLVLLLGFALRAAHLDFGLDTADIRGAQLQHQQDEEGMVRRVREGFMNGDPNPGVFMMWGALGYHLFGVADTAVVGVQALDHPDGWGGRLAELAENPSLLHFVHRCVSLFAGLITILLVWVLARRELGERVALVAALILSTAYLPVRESHFGTLDALTTLWVIAAVDRALLIARAPTKRNHVMAGLFIGLAAATKYFGAIAALPVIAGHLASRDASDKSDARARPSFLWLVLAGLAAVLTWLAVTANAVYAPGEFMETLGHQSDRAAIRWDLDEWARVAGLHLRWSLVVGLGVTAFAAALIGCVLGWRARGPARGIVTCCVLLLPMLFFVRAAPVRYALSLVTLLCIPAAFACERLATRGGTVRRGLLALLVLLAIAPGAIRSVAFDRALGNRDTRQDVLDHLASAGATPQDVLAIGFYGLPRPSMVFGQPPFMDYLRMTWPRGGVISREEGQRMRPRFILHDHTAHEQDPIGWDDFAEVVAREYRQVLHVDPRTDPDAVALPDQDAGTPSFLMAYAEPWKMTRPGPPLTLYERVEP